MKVEIADIVIVGAGAAGLMAAISAGRAARRSRADSRILLLDSRPRVGAKILMSGGTRCNVTNQEVLPPDFEGGPRHFIKHVFEAFPPAETLGFFEKAGVKLVLEPGGKYFPETHSARTVLMSLLKESEAAGVELKAGRRILSGKKENDLFTLETEDGFKAVAKRAVLATGGLSYPGTGSDGTGYQIAAGFGHSLNPTFPALTPLITADPDWKSLSGVSLNARLSFFKDGRKSRDYRDSFLFTHFGFSGPAALNVSRHFAAAPPEEKPQILASFLPEEDEASVSTAFRRALEKNSAQPVKSFLVEKFSLPARLAGVLLKKSGLEEAASLSHLASSKRSRLFQRLLQCPLEVKGVYGYRKAEVTAGGIDLKEINRATLESKRVKGLYFCGEILDVDGRIGGFNFQWAWSTGAIAGRSAARSLS